jgi:ribosomal protein S2
MKVPVIAIMSSDCDIAKITTPVVINDALKASVNLALEELTNAYIDGRKKFTPAAPQRFVRTQDTRPRTTAPRA